MPGCAGVRVHNPCAYMWIHMGTQGCMHTQLITSVSSSWHLHTCFHLNAHIPTTHWVQYAESVALRAGLSQLPNSLHLSGVSWHLLTANYSPGADQPFNELWQLSAEDKIKRQTHIVLTAWWSGIDWCQQTTWNYNSWIFTTRAGSMVRNKEKESGGHHGRVQAWGEGLKTTLSCWAMDRAHPGLLWYTATFCFISPTDWSCRN